MIDQKEKKQLIASATYKGYVKLGEKWGQPTVLTDIAYYFNEDKEELGYIVWDGSEHEGIHTFSPPRIWGEKFLRGASLYEIDHSIITS